MNILYVTPYVPSRIRVRPLQFIKALSQTHQISLVSLLCNQYEQVLVQDVAEYCTSVELVRLPKWQAYTNCLRHLPTNIPLRVAYYQSPAFVRRIAKLLQVQRIDVIHAELIKVVPALRAALSQVQVPSVYDSVDCISLYLEQQRQTTSSAPHKLFVSTELKKMRSYEHEAQKLFDNVVISASRDRDYLIEAGGDPEHIHVVPNGVDTQYFVPSHKPRQPDSLVFCAKLDYYPNVQAVLWFCREVLPLVWKQRPQVTLSIVGNNPPPAINTLSNDKRIAVTGFVPDIRPYLGTATVALAPLQVAAGMQNKVLEALAMGTPLVATSAACKSLEVKHGKHLLIAKEPASFAEALLTLLEQPQQASDLAQAGRFYVEQHHSWESAGQQLSEIYEMSLSSARRTPTRNVQRGHQAP
jgi:sugar transferase (PEP-CTERM/EpsH1 system associated)